MTSYTFGNHMAAHKFCKICGVHILIDMLEMKPEVWERLPESVKEILRVKMDQVPVRLAVLEGVEWDALKVVRKTPGTEGYVIA